MTTKQAIKQRATAGLTLTEMIVTMLIVVMMSGLLTVGVNLALRSYKDVTSHAEARALCSTLASIVGNELRYTTVIKTETEGGKKKVTAIQPVEFSKQLSGNALAEIKATDGRLVMRGTSDGTEVPLVNEASYGDGMRRLYASVEITRSNSPSTRGSYDVLLIVRDAENHELTRSDYDVIPANKPDFT